MPKCKICGKEIFFITTISGELLPCELRLITYYKGKKMSQLMKENDCTEYDNCNNNFQSTTCFQSNDKFLSQSPESDPGPDPLLLYVCS